MTDTAAAEIHRLRLFLTSLVIVVVLGLAGWWAWNMAAGNGTAKADERIACVKRNLESTGTTRDCS